jgi:sulfofructose kinase
MKLKKLTSPHDRFDIRFPERHFDVVGFGLNSVDHLCVVDRYPDFNSKAEIQEYKMLAGGQVATAISFLSNVGLKTKYVGKVGSDDLGRFSRQTLNAERVDTSAVITEQGARNQYAFIIIDKRNGERTILWQRDPQLNFKASELSEVDICSGRILHLDGYDAEAAVQAALWCQQQGIPVSIDLDRKVENCKELVENVDFLIASDNFPSEFTGIRDPGKAFWALQNYYQGFLAVTLGEKGAVTAIGDRCHVFPGLRIAALDTTGAGDIFHGGFIYGLLRNWPLDRIMAFANSAAGLSCLQLGAKGGICGLPEIMAHAEELLARKLDIDFSPW